MPKAAANILANNKANNIPENFVFNGGSPRLAIIAGVKPDLRFASKSPRRKFYAHTNAD
jgi:hypothetical protein